MANFLLVTGNKDKIAEAERILGEKVDFIKLELDELQELDPTKIAEHKVKQAFSLTNKPVVTWDVSLFISCLNGFPGPLIKWFWTQVSLDKICEIAHFYKDPNIKAQTILTYYDGIAVKHFLGEANGKIPSVPKGNGGFGWDPIFIPEGLSLTYSEMDPKDPLFHSFNNNAFIELKNYLRYEKK